METEGGRGPAGGGGAKGGDRVAQSCLRGPLSQSSFLSGEKAAFCHSIDCLSVLIVAGVHG